MIQKLLLWPSLLLLTVCHPISDKTDGAFNLHLFQEPLHLDPARQRASSASYFFYNTLRGLYRIDSNNQLVSEGGSCRWKNPQTLKCQIENQFWSDGSPVTSDDYLRSFEHLRDPATASPRAHLLHLVKSFVKKNERQFEIIFLKKDPEFLYKLSSTALYPIHKDRPSKREDFNSFMTNGPYSIEQWEFGKEMTLKPNPYYQKGHPNRPQVRFYFIDDEMTAWRLYEKKKLQFLRRIPSKMFDRVLNRPDFHQVPMLRFDYIGFGQLVRDSKDLRAALALSIDYMQLKKLLHALEQPGCPSLPKTWMTHQPCYQMDLEKARGSLEKVPEELRRSRLQLKVSQLGGNDIRKQAEFYQAQWKTHLGLNVEVAQVEQKVFLNELRKDPPDIFRKGVGLDLPTCKNALETFGEDSKQNFLNLKNSSYLKIIDSMSRTENEVKMKTLCQKGIEELMNDFNLIPLGEMHFGIMAQPEFVEWTLNGLNQLDLAQLHKL